MSNGPFLVASSYDIQITLTNLSLTKDTPVIRYHLQNTQANCIRYHKEGTFFIASNPHILCYDISLNKQDKPVCTYFGHSTNVMDLCIAEPHMYSCSEDKSWIKWEIGVSKSTDKVVTKSALASILLIKNRSLLITGNEKGQVEVWDPETRSLLHSNSVFSNHIRSLVEVPDDGVVIAGCQDGKVAYLKIDGEKVEIIHTFQAHDDIVTRLVISPNLKYFVTCSADSTAKVWDVSTKELFFHIKGEGMTKWVWDAAFTADSEYVATGGTDKILRLWNLNTKSLVVEYNWHQKGVTALTITH